MSRPPPTEQEWRRWPERRLLEETFSRILKVEAEWPKVTEEVFRLGGRVKVNEDAIVDMRRSASQRFDSTPPARSGSGRHVLVEHAGRTHPVDASLYEAIAIRVHAEIETAGDAKKWRGLLGFGGSTLRSVVVLVVGALVLAFLSIKLGIQLGGHP